ncbi:MAG: hypothetical protein ACRCTM_07235 [Sphaerotilus sulfidivorans]
MQFDKKNAANSKNKFFTIIFFDFDVVFGICGALWLVFGGDGLFFDIV